MIEPDQVYDLAETVNDASPYESPLENTLFVLGAGSGYCATLYAEAMSGREPGEYGREDTYAALGMGGLVGGAAGTAIDGLQELGKTVGVQYGEELGMNETSATAVGASLGAASGAATAEGIRRFLSGGDDA